MSVIEAVFVARHNWHDFFDRASRHTVPFQVVVLGAEVVVGRAVEPFAEVAVIAPGMPHAFAYQEGEFPFQNPVRSASINEFVYGCDAASDGSIRQHPARIFYPAFLDQTVRYCC